MHIGHSIPFTFCKWLQDVFDVPYVPLFSAYHTAKLTGYQTCDNAVRQVEVSAS